MGSADRLSSKSNTVVQHLKLLEKKYSIAYPASFMKLAETEPKLFEEGWGVAVGNNFLYPPDNFLKDPDRLAEMPAGLLPFGHENGSKFCFLFGLEGSQSEPPVVHWFMDDFGVTPIASTFRGFLWYQFVIEECSVMGFYDPNFNQSYLSDDKRRKSKERVARISETFGIPYEFGPKPAPDNEEDYFDFHKAFIEVDPRAPQSLCWIGKRHLDNDDFSTAKEYLRRSIEAAPYLAAPHHFMARIRTEEGKEREALELHWQSVCCPLYLSGSAIYEFDVGVQSEAFPGFKERISPQAFAALREDEEKLLEIADEDPLAEYIMSSEPCDVGARADLAQKYVEMNQLGKAAREWENVLYLASTEERRTKQALQSLLDLYKRLGYDWAVAMHSDPGLY